MEHGPRRAAEVTGAGIGYVASLTVGSTLLGLLRVSSATPVISSALGAAVTVGAGAVAASSAILAGALFVNDRGVTAPQPRTFRSIDEAIKWATMTLESADRRRLVAATAGCLLISRGVFGARFSSVLPSDVRLPGAFATAQTSVPTGTAYASSKERELIIKMGRRHGCHSCGTMRAKEWVADHQPPNKYVKSSNWWLSFIGKSVPQAYYAQCRSCSNLQGQALRPGIEKQTLVYHLPMSLRHHHAAGAWTAFLNPDIFELASARK